MSKEPPIIEAQNITKSYDVGDNSLPILRGISLKIKKGEFVAIMGPSGSGKSTLLHILGCLDKPTSGSLYINGELVSEKDDDELALIREKYIGFVFQSFYLLSHLTAIQNVELPMIISKKPPSFRRKRAEELLQSVGLGNRLNHFPLKMSGGERQRVAIARALANEPEIILADEPTGNLDTKAGKEVMSILSSLHSKGKTIVVITHDPDIAKYAQRVIKIKDGLIEREEVNA